jgi:alpha-galactosidase
LAKDAGIPYSEMQWKCGGVNHLAWFTELNHNGQSIYPTLRKNIDKDPELLASNHIRYDMMKHFGYYVTESSGHFSEYLPFYRKRQELIDKYCGEKYLGESGFYAREWPGWRVNCDENRRKMVKGEEEITTNRTWEYASYIIQAVETNSPFIAHVTVPNTGLIPNLPLDGMVEVATIFNRNGATPTYFGRLPAQCAALCDWHMRMYDLAATACIEKSKEAAVLALMLDPHTASVCCPEEIRNMTNELFEAEKEFLPGFK